MASIPPVTLDLASVVVDQTIDEPLYLQIHRGVRDSILNSRLPPGLRLPSSRSLARTWGISRSTVLTAIDQLKAEGYLEGRAGSGVYVTRAIPDCLTAVSHAGERSRAARGGNATVARISQRGAVVCDIFANGRGTFDNPGPFRPGIPAEGTFPSMLWRRLTSRVWRDFDRHRRPALDPMGYPPLRDAIATHLGAGRGVSCDADQIVIVSSTQHALMTLGQILLDAGDVVWVEDPGYLRAQAALKAIGAELAPIPVDEEGIDLEYAARRAPAAGACYVTPSHQYPLGTTMSLSRRLALLDWSHRSDSWIIEDDYMAEYRYSGQPLMSLQGLDETSRVIYLGTFSKMFSPALRLGYIVVPKSLIPAFTAVRSLIDRCPSFIDQAVLAEFIQQGHLARHVRRTRTLYDDRHKRLRVLIRNEIPLLRLQPAESGMHIVAWLPDAAVDGHVARQLAGEGVTAFPLSNMCQRSLKPALILGYAGWDQTQTAQAVHRMKDVLQRL